MTMPICISAPGSIMLLGEHAVLHGRQALVCAINRRLRVHVTARADDGIELQTDLGAATGTLSAPPERAELAFLCAAVARYRGRLETGFRLVVTSEADTRQGLGTSAAVVVAALAALETLVTGELPVPARLFDAALAVVQGVQG
ncbi:MAG: GHMP kinase, partial [Candidatus Marinimicrobia bacterium]|nr:GHMP kinase [Candidatus Neomarinimicrobiota bacterium]